MLKKIYSYVIIALVVFLQINNAYSGDRNILVERFTSSTCGPCATANPTLDSYLNSADPNKVTSISYHMNWPSPGNDPMYLSNTADNTARRTAYGVNSIPYWFFDGTYIGGTSNGILQASYNSRTDVLSPVTIVVTQTINGTSVTVNADIYCEFAISNPTAIIHIAVTEKVIQYASPPGVNGETYFRNVMRKMLPSNIGTPVSLIPGTKTTVQYTYTIDPSWQASQIENIVFVQSTSNQIYNSAIPTLDFNLISAPSYKVVNQGQSQSANYKVKIPVVASGYNSAVTFTGALETPTSGINIDFTSGNVISNYPDSLAFTVSSNSAVPAGVYKVILTGTNTNGKVHKTIVNYLVGKNYALYGVNRTQASYKVDNVVYNVAKLFTWDIGSEHTFEAVSPITIGSTRYVFDQWNIGGGISQNITVGIQDINCYAYYKVQYKLFSSVSPAELPVTVNGGNTFYDSSSAANISATPSQLVYNGKTYYFSSWEGAGNGSYTGSNPNPSVNIHNVISEKAIYDTVDVGISNYNSVIPDKFNLYQNYPNPFNPTTSIKFDIAKSSFTTIIVYNSLGKEVSKLVNENLNPGSYQFSFDASAYPSGVYYYRINTEAFTQIKKMILLK